MHKKTEKGHNSMVTVCGLTDKRAHEITMIFLVAHHSNTIWSKTVEDTIAKAKITTMREGLYLGWIFSQMYGLEQKANLLRKTMEV